jgi:hypothetical protein
MAPALAGCGGKVVERTDVGPGASDTGDGHQELPGAQSPEADPESCHVNVELSRTAAPPPSVTAADLACCNDHLQATVTAGSTAVHDAEFVSCCKAIIMAGYSQTPPVDPTVRNACCFGNEVAPQADLWDYPLCTPWGPPVPPDMDALDLEVA